MDLPRSRECGRSRCSRGLSRQPAAPHRWTWAAGVVLAILYAVAAVLGMRTAPVLWAGTTVLLTWAVLGLLALGAVFSRGRRRARRIGAVLFGVGYLLLISRHTGEETWAEIPGNRLLGAVRPYLRVVPTERRAASEGIAGANARILKALDQPISFHFPTEVPLEDALRYVSTTARTDDGRPLPIYVNPIALQEVDRTLQSPVSLVLEGVPLRTGLDCLLRQVSLTYEIKGGLIEVVSDIDRIEHQGYNEPCLRGPAPADRALPPRPRRGRARSPVRSAGLRPVTRAGNMRKVLSELCLPYSSARNGNLPFGAAQGWPAVAGQTAEMEVRGFRRKQRGVFS